MVVYRCPVGSVAEPSQFSSATAPDFFFWLRLQKTNFDTKHQKNLNFHLKKSPIHLDFVSKTEKNLKNTFSVSKNLFLYLTVGRVNKYYLIYKKCTVGTVPVPYTIINEHVYHSVSDPDPHGSA